MNRRWGSFLCLYCGGHEPDAQPSLAHVFPDALGGVHGCSDTTCINCNGITNREIEQEAAKRLETLRSAWGVPNRRRTATKVDAHVSGPGVSASVRVSDPSTIEEAIVRSRDQADGRQYVVVGPAEAVERTVAEIRKRRPEMTWIGSDVAVEINVRVESEPDAPVFLRLATKIALERLADLRGPAFVREPEFSDARDFVLTGNSPAPLAGCIADPRWVDAGAPLAFPVPGHAIALFGQPEDRVLGAVVVLFGLYTYWVVLTQRYDGLAAWDDLLYEDPLTGKTDSPLVRTGVPRLRLPWRAWRQTSATSPEQVRQMVRGHVMRKLQASADAHWGPDEDEVPPNT